MKLRLFAGCLLVGVGHLKWGENQARRHYGDKCERCGEMANSNHVCSINENQLNKLGLVIVTYEMSNAQQLNLSTTLWYLGGKYQLRRDSGSPQVSAG